MSNPQTLLIAENNDVETAIRILTEELYVTGYPSLPSYDESKNTEYLLIPLINTVWILIKHRKKYVAEKREIDHNKMMLEQNIKILQKKISNLESNQKIMKSDFKRLMNDLEVTKRSKEQVLQELNDSKTANQKLQKLLQSRNEDYLNKFRQKENELIELQKMLLQKIDVRRNYENLSGNAALSGTFDDHILNERVKQIEKMHVKNIFKLENTVQTLVQENINLRNSIELFVKKLYQLYQEITSVLMKDYLPAYLEDFASEFSPCDDDSGVRSKHLFHIPGDNILNYVEEYVTRIINKILEHADIQKNSKPS